MRIDHTNKKYGRLTFVEYVGFKRNQTYWRVRCDCGTTKEVAVRGVLAGDSMSCGCLATEKRVQSCKSRTLPKEEANFVNLFHTYKCRAKKRNIEFNLSKEEFRALVTCDCKYCGQKPSQVNRRAYKGKESGFLYTGIDRVDNEQGYTVLNSVPCCFRCNTMKLDMSENEFYTQIRVIYGRSGRFI